jgi:hypothetical protein
MKKIFTAIIATASLAALMCSCEDNFDPQIYGKLFSNNFPKTEADYESYLMTCYIPFGNTWGYDFGGSWQHTLNIPEGGLIRMLDSTSDICYPWTVGNWGGGWLQLSQANYANCHLYNRASGGGSPSHFEKVRDVTRFTEIIGTLEKGEELSGEKKAQFIGEARLLRGLVMYYLLHIYGPVPVIVDPALVGNLEAEQNMARPSLAEMAKFIYDDFEYAGQNMANSAPRGRYTADYARFCLMRHCLNEGAHMAGYYDKAIEMYAALNTGKYSLYTAGGDEAYARQFMQANKFNVEVIMALSTSASGDGTNSKGDFNPLSFYVVPSNVARYADAANTIPTPFALQGGGWGQVFNVSPDFYDTYEEADLRRNVILTSYVRNDNDRTLITREDIGSQWSGFILNKYPIEINNPFQPTDIPLARWADVLLMYAEASARKAQAVPSGEALQAVNEVRARAGLAPLEGAALASYESFLDALLAERGHELLYEGNRKIDLVRFNKYRRNCKLYKGLEPTHQYMPIPNYAVQQAETYGIQLSQEFAREGWEIDRP